MVKVAVCKEKNIHLPWIETKVLPVFLVHFPASLVHAAVDKNGFIPATDHVTGSGHLTVGTVKFKFHFSSPFQEG
jgi:hypothetical protein